MPFIGGASKFRQNGDGVPGHIRDDLALAASARPPTLDQRYDAQHVLTEEVAGASRIQRRPHRHLCCLAVNSQGAGPEAVVVVWGGPSLGTTVTL